VTLTIVATPLPSDPEPRIQLNITDTAGGGSAFTLTRTDPDGRSRKIIIEPNPHLTSGSWAGYDYHAPFNESVTYTATTTVAATSASVVLSMSTSWLIHRTNPALSVQIDKVMSTSDRVATSTGMPHWAFGAEFPVVRNENVRHAKSGSVTLKAFTKAKLAALESILHDSGVILMNLTNGNSAAWFDVSWAWIQPGDVTYANPTGNGWVYYPTRDVTFTYQIVDVPAGAISPLWTYGMLLADVADFPSYASVASGYHNYGDVVIDNRAI
jgi:hypothetical protein